MNRKPKKPTAPATLRRRAEARLWKRPGGKRSEAGVSKAQADLQRLHHELQVHQVELEMQNAELQENQDRMEVLLEKFTDLYDFAPVGYFSLDDHGRILEVNLTGAAQLGVDRSRLINGFLPRFLAPASHSVFLAFLERVFAGTQKQVCEVQLLKRDAAVSWASIHGIPAISLNGPRSSCRVAVSDITSIKQAEEILRRSAALFSALIEQAPVGVYVVDDQFRLQQVNPKARPVFSKIHPLQGRGFSEILHLIWPDRIADQVMERFRQTLKTGKPYYSPEFSERRRDIGVIECYEWQLQRITLPAGHHGVVCFFNNITERKRQEEIQRRLDATSASNRKLELEIVQRKATESALRKSELHSRQLLEQSRHMEGRLRRLSREILSAEEEERKRISRELHDVIAQTLTGINVRLAALQKEAAANPKGLDQRIASTQQLVEHSVSIVHRFARELRPTVLDDLGLIPALHAFIKSFQEETGIRGSLSAFAAVEQVNEEKRTVLYRVAQEALTNTARHAQASRVDVVIQKLDRTVCMKINDNGKGFLAERVLHSRKSKRLGLLGINERLEMVGGSLTITSAPGKGTTIQAQIPLEAVRAPGRQQHR